MSPLNGERRSELWIVNVETGQPRQLDVGDAVKASWSPHGDRIAYHARNWADAESGKDAAPGTDVDATSRKDDAQGMDVWTIPARGGDPVAVTSDTWHNWSPVWSTDGRYLYFVSDRGGSMNLWRVAIDERSGRRRGDPEPVTTPAPLLAHPSLSADGRLIAYSAVSKTTNIRRLTLDPTTDPVTAKDDPTPVTSGSREWANPDPTWDGEWVVFYSQAEGDVYVSRPDGTGRRSVNPGSSVDRVPRWSPDKMWIAFFTDGRGPGMNVWTIRADGSSPQRVGEGTVPVWSPDGSRMATSRADVEDGRTDIFDYQLSR